MSDFMLTDPEAAALAGGDQDEGRSVSSGFGPAAPVYLNFVMKSFQKQLAYKFEYFVGVFNGLLFIFIFTSLWAAVYKNSEAAAASPFTMKEMISYAVFAMLFRISMSMEDLGVAQKVRTGAIGMDLIKPVNYFLMLLSEAFGQTMFHWVTRVAPILVVSLMAFDVTIPRGAGVYAMTAVAWVLGYAILFLINFAFALIAFWVLETFSFQLMKFGLFTLFSGGIVPIDFFPEWMKPFIAFIPFQYILYVPTSVFIGHIKGGAALGMILLQGAFVAALSVLCYAMWSAARRKLVVQGG